MRNMVISGASAVALSTGIVQAGGYESSALSTAFMYEDGGYVEFATGKRDYEVTGSKYAPAGSALKASVCSLKASWSGHSVKSAGMTRSSRQQ